MGSAGIELPRPVNRQTVEKAHAMAVRGPQDHEYSFMQAGMRAARARDPKLLLALEKGAEVLDAMSDEQMGQTRRESSATRAQKAQHTEASLWREAYRLCDEGRPIQQLGWIYAAASWLAGLHIGISHY